MNRKAECHQKVHPDQTFEDEEEYLTKDELEDGREKHTRRKKHVYYEQIRDEMSDDDFLNFRKNIPMYST